jgi:hypothetical protein
MKRIKIIRDGIVTHQTEQPNAAADAWLVEHKEGLGDPSQYQVVEEDMTAEIAAKDAAKAQRNQLRSDLRAHRDRTGNLTAAQMSDAIKGILKLLSLEVE